MKHTFEYALRDRLKELEIHTGGDHSYNNLAKFLGVSRHTVASVANNDVDQKKLAMLAGILDYFQSNGLPLGLEDLFRLSTIADE